MGRHALPQDIPSENLPTIESLLETTITELGQAHRALVTNNPSLFHHKCSNATLLISMARLIQSKGATTK